MPEPTEPAPLREPVALDYLSPTPPAPGLQPSRASYLALVLGVLSIPLLLLLLGTVAFVGAEPPATVMGVLWISCVMGALAAGMLGVFDARRRGRGGGGMSWVGVLIGVVMIGLMFVVLALAIFAWNK